MKYVDIGLPSSCNNVHTGFSRWAVSVISGEFVQIQTEAQLELASPAVSAESPTRTKWRQQEPQVHKDGAVGRLVGFVEVGIPSYMSSHWVCFWYQVEMTIV